MFTTTPALSRQLPKDNHSQRLLDHVIQETDGDVITSDTTAPDATARGHLHHWQAPYRCRSALAAARPRMQAAIDTWRGR